MQQDKRNGMEQMFQELEQQEKERLDRMEKKTEEIRASAQVKELSTTDRAKQSRDSGNPDIDGWSWENHLRRYQSGGRSGDCGYTHRIPCPPDWADHR